MTVFAMKVVEEWELPGDVGVILAFGDGHREAYLEVYEVRKQSTFDGLSLQFRVDDIDEFTVLLPEDIAYDGPIDRPWGSRYLYLRDPNNIQIIVYDAGL